jgi:hypothetical protein
MKIIDTIAAAAQAFFGIVIGGAGIILTITIIFRLSPTIPLTTPVGYLIVTTIMAVYGAANIIHALK